MSCTEFTEGTLSDYTDRVLNVGGMWRFRRHLRRCDACAATVSALQSLNRDARGLYVTETIPLPTPRRRVPVRPLLAGAAVAALALWFAPEMPGRPGTAVAFAEVEDAMRHVRTAHWQSTFVIYDGGGKREEERDNEHWAQTRPLLYASKSRTVYSRIGSCGPATDTMMRDTLYDSVLRRGDGRWVPIVATAAERARGIRFPVEMSLKIGLFLQDAANKKPIPPRLGAPKPDSKLSWTQERVVEQGRSLILFHYNYTAPLNTATAEMWVDPNTRHLVRSVKRSTYYQRTTSGGRHRFRIAVSTADNFRYNEPLPQEVLHFGEAQIKARLAEREAAERAGVRPPPIP